MSKGDVVKPLPAMDKLTLLNDLGQAVLSSSDLDSLFQKAADLLKERLHFQYVMIGTIDYRQEKLETRATAGIEPDAKAPLTQGLGDGIIGEAVSAGRTIVINDVSENPRYVQSIPSTRSELCLPFKVAGRVVGFLNIESDRVGAFERADVESLEAVGSFLGQAVRNADLRRELEQSRNYLESVLQHAGDAIVTLDRQGRIRTWNNVAEQILDLRREDALCRNVRELLQGAPEYLQGIFDLVVSGELIRDLQMKHRGGDGRIRTLEVSMAPVVDSQGAVAGVSCILRDISDKIEAEAELQRKLQAEQVLNRISVEITSILELDKLLDQVARITREFIEYELFAILLVDEAKDEFVWKVSVGYSEESYRELQRLSIHEGIVGRVVRTRTAVIVNDTASDPDYKRVRTRSGQDPQSELAIPLVSKDRAIGVLILESTLKGYFQPHHLRLLTPLAAQVAVAIENASLYEEKTRDALTKQVMNDIGKEMTAILELDELLNRIAVLIRRVIEYEILGIFLWSPETERLELKVAIGYSPETVERARAIRLGEGIAGHAARQRRRLVVTDLAKDPRAIRSETVDGRTTESEVALPLIAKDRLLGVLVLESCDAAFFSAERIQVLETLASQLSVSIENARLFRQIMVKEQKLEADFALARDLQFSMLPPAHFSHSSYDFAALYKPAESLGGDYYDYLWLDQGTLGLAIGDVSGKGVAAAMSMAATRSALRFAARVNTSPSQVLYHVNRRLYRDIKKRTFVSLFYGCLDLENRTLRWSNAGHYPPLLRRADGRTEELSKGGGTVLAVFDKERYASAKAQLSPGDILCFYTDGILEARDPRDEEFGLERIVDLLNRNAGENARGIVRAFSGELRKFTRAAAQHDDITILILKA